MCQLKLKPSQRLLFDDWVQIPPSPPWGGGDKNLLKVPLLKGDLGGSRLGVKATFIWVLGLI
ncbi:MAG TPA: hypothetical protein DD001_14245 [Microcoleaceae bacterium UBA10368]|nr:hypothetical protein [Microcoleaceae cyanobacterium UBA10368]